MASFPPAPDPDSSVLPASPMSAPSSSSSSFSSVSTAVTASLLQTSHLTPKVAKQVIRSFSLLGINEYLYSLKKTDVHHAMNSLNTPTSINASSFDKTNERTLLVLLHFLLSILSPEFKTEVSNFWPYQDTKEKNEIKLRVQEYLIRQIQTGVLDHSDCRASILTVARGYQVWVLLWKLSDAALDCILTTKAGIGPFMDIYKNTPTEIKSLADDVITSMNDELEATRERVRIRREYAAKLEIRLKDALDKIEENKAKLRKLGSSPKGVYLTSNAKLERSEMVERIKKTKQEIIAIAASFKGESNSHGSQNIVCSNRVQTILGSKDAGAVKVYLDKKLGLLKNLSIRSTQEYKERGVVDDGDMVSEEELDTIREECSLASELSKSLLKDMKQKYLEEEEEEEEEPGYKSR